MHHLVCKLSVILIYKCRSVYFKTNLVAYKFNKLFLFKFVPRGEI